MKRLKSLLNMSKITEMTMSDVVTGNSVVFFVFVFIYFLITFLLKDLESCQKKSHTYNDDNKNYEKQTGKCRANRKGKKRKEKKETNSISIYPYSHLTTLTHAHQSHLMP